MDEVFGLIGWAFSGKATNFAGLLIRWWVRITALWVILLLLVAALMAGSVFIQPDAGAVFGAYLTLEGCSLLAMVGPILLAAAMLAVYCAVQATVFAVLFVAALLGVIG
jgi:hypothetical protein